MSADCDAVSKEANEGSDWMTNAMVKKEPVEEPASEQLNARDFEYPVESVYVKGEPAEEITCEINPLEGHEFENSTSETAAASQNPNDTTEDWSTMHRFILASQSQLGSRKMECPFRPSAPLDFTEHRLSLRQAQPIDTLEKLKQILHSDGRNRRQHRPSRLKRETHILPDSEETSSHSNEDNGRDLASRLETTASQAAQTTARPRPFVCPECNKTFAQTSNLKDHILTHTGERPFGCEQCGWRFKHGSHLKSHLKTHIGLRQFGCHICARRFIRGSDLRNHIVLHAGEKPFGCQDCSKRFSRKDHLIRHVRTFHAVAEGVVEGLPT